MSISCLKIDGGELAVEVEGDAPLVVCSPGMGDTRDAFAPLAAQLVTSEYRVARVDFRGHGDSSARFNRYGDEATAEDFLMVIEALGGGPAVLAGAPLSAAAAVIAAGRRPDQVAGLVLLGPFLRNGVSEMVRSIFKFALMRPWGPILWPQAAKLWPGLGDKASERATVTVASLHRHGRWAAFQATAAGADHRVVAPWIGRVKAPVLVVMGDADPDWADPLAEAKWVASNFTEVDTLSVPGAGHAPMFERPEIVNPALLQFLQKIRLGSGFKPSNA